MKRQKKISGKIITIFMLITITIIGSNIYAATDFVTNAKNWFDLGGDTTVTSAVKNLVDEIAGYIQLVGTVLIVAATIVQGIRYVYGSASGKADSKNSLVNLLTAALLFFGWSNIYSLLVPSNNTLFLYETTNGQNFDFNIAILRAFNIFKIIAQALAVIGVLYVGIKYLFAGAEGKSNLKGKSWQFIVGIIMIFATIQVLTFVSNIVLQATSSSATNIYGPQQDSDKKEGIDLIKIWNKFMQNLKQDSDKKEGIDWIKTWKKVMQNLNIDIKDNNSRFQFVVDENGDPVKLDIPDGYLDLIDPVAPHPSLPDGAVLV